MAHEDFHRRSIRLRGYDYTRAAWCNQYVLHVADRIVIGGLRAGGMLACLLADLPADKPVVFLAGES